METCDICNSYSVFPEKISSAVLCKKCFFKLNGPIWKYRSYTRLDDVEDTKAKTLRKATQKNASTYIIDNIAQYFDKLKVGMNSCNVCGTITNDYQVLGNSRICQACFAKICRHEWKQDEYDRNDDVEKNRKTILKFAKKNSFPDDLIDEINKHFDAYLQKDLIDTVYGCLGQRIKIYPDRCIIITDNSCKVSDFCMRYSDLRNLINESESSSPTTASFDFKTTLFEEGILNAGAKFVVTGASFLADDNQEEALSIDFRFLRGSCEVDYDKYDVVDFVFTKATSKGFIRFRDSRHNNPHHDAVFFFEHNLQKYQHLYCKIQENMFLHRKDADAASAAAAAAKQDSNNPSKAEESTSTFSVADELLKFKKLLDMKVISKAEFNKKKAELLGA